MRTKEEVKAELAEIEEREKEEERKAVRQKNYENFKKRSSDWMIGKAHADLEFINIPYKSDENKALLPVAVTVHGNMGHTYHGEAPLTSATHTYFHNVWNNDYTRNEVKFQEKLNKLVQEEVERICRQLPVVLEMLGLQSNRYWITKQHFPEDKLDEVRHDVEAAQAEILNKYPDDEFLKLIRRQGGWVYQDGTPMPEYQDVSLYHSRMILFRYIFKHRPSLQQAYKQCKFYKTYKKDIERS